ncbi:MAG: hypothetical protein ACSHYF_10820 [Verrucomicrobiaceae bacterium]
MKTLSFLALALLWSALPAAAQGLDSDPDVVYVEEFSEKPIKLKAAKAGYVFSTKKGGRKRGALQVDSTVELVGFTENAYQIRGRRENGEGVSGWVSPLALTAKDKDFVKKFKAVFDRQIIVRELIENKELAIGMTEKEVGLVLGEPTKTKVRRTATGQSATWEYVEYEIENHYSNFRDPITGGIYRQLTHTTKEVVSKTQVEFENGVVNAIEESEDKGEARRRIVATPIIFFW